MSWVILIAVRMDRDIHEFGDNLEGRLTNLVELDMNN